MNKLTENLTILSEELSTAKKSLQKKCDILQAQAKKGSNKTTEQKKKSTGELPSPCGGFEQQLAKAEQLCDTLQTENEVGISFDRTCIIISDPILQFHINLSSKPSVEFT